MSSLGSHSARHGRRGVIKVDAIFLAIMAVFGLTQDLLSYGWGAGRFETYLLGDPRAIGFVEAHALAGVIAVAALLTAARSHTKWHFLLAAVHTTLGGCNLVFFAGFIETGETELALAVTLAHFIFVTLNLASAASSLRLSVAYRTFAGRRGA